MLNKRAIKIYQALGVILAGSLLISACTSSSTNVATNPSYERDYTTSTRSRQTSTGGSEEFPQETYRPPITLMMVAMNTNEVLPGEEYPIFAVVDNPQNRDLTLRWSVEAGELKEAPEAERSDLLSYLEQLKTNKGVEAKGASGPSSPEAQSTTPEGPATAGAEGPAGSSATPPSRPPITPPAQTSPGGTSPSSPSAKAETSGKPEAEEKPEELQPSNVDTPGSQTEETGEEAPSESESESGGSTNESPEAGDTPNEKGEGSDLASYQLGGLRAELASFTLQKPSLRFAFLAPEEEPGNTEELWPEPKPKENAGKADKEETVGSDSADDEMNEAAEDVEASASETEKAVEESKSESEEFEGFQPKPGTGELVEVEDETVDEGEAEEETEEEKLVHLETDEPFVIWVPPAVGGFTIRVVALDEKGNELTEERSLPVTVSEPRPRTSLVWNTTRKLNEDDYLVVELRAQALPAYSKGLFTLSYDTTVMSFRVAEIGSFFPKSANNTIYFAEHPAKRGTVTLAISTDALDMPKGDGVLARIIFKVKEPVDDPASLKITEVTSEEARYVLDAEGSNVLPVPTENPIFATEWKEPPARPTQTRATGTPGEQVPEAPAPPSTQTPGTRPERPGFSPTVPGGSTSGTGGPTQPGLGETETPEGGPPPAERDSGQTQQSERDSLAKAIQTMEETRKMIASDPNMPEEQKQSELQRIDQEIQDMRDRLASLGG